MEKSSLSDEGKLLGRSETPKSEESGFRRAVGILWSYFLGPANCAIAKSAMSLAVE